MSDKMVDLTPAAKRLAGLVARVSDEELGRPTPCPAYTLGDLIEHIGGLALAFRAAAEKDTASPYVNHTPSGDAARLGEGWRDRIPADLAALARAWAGPEAWTGMTRIASQDAPAEMVGITVADELVVHGWDMARATGQPYAAEPELVDAAGTFLGMFASPDAPAGPEVAFGPSRELPGGAPALDRVLALAGRDLSWPAG
ncbi:MAG TPA: TIGR03086 family metal-binding protein [Streptosporangiaceae bacterium]